MYTYVYVYIYMCIYIYATPGLCLCNVVGSHPYSAFITLSFSGGTKKKLNSHPRKL